MGDATDPGPLECSCGNVPDAARRRESRMRRVGYQEKLAAIRYRATALKICGDGSANIGRQRHDRLLRSEERRVGKEGGSTWRSRWSPTHEKKNSEPK